MLCVHLKKICSIPKKIAKFSLKNHWLKSNSFQYHIIYLFYYHCRKITLFYPLMLEWIEGRCPSRQDAYNSVIPHLPYDSSWKTCMVRED